MKKTIGGVSEFINSNHRRVTITIIGDRLLPPTCRANYELQNVSALCHLLRDFPNPTRTRRIMDINKRLSKVSRLINVYTLAGNVHQIRYFRSAMNVYLQSRRFQFSTQQRRPYVRIDNPAISWQ